MARPTYNEAPSPEEALRMARLASRDLAEKWNLCKTAYAAIKDSHDALLAACQRMDAAEDDFAIAEALEDVRAAISKAQGKD